MPTFHEHPLIIFLVILLADKQTNDGENITARQPVAEVTIYLLFLALPM